MTKPVFDFNYLTAVIHMLVSRVLKRVLKPRIVRGPTCQCVRPRGFWSCYLMMNTLTISQTQSQYLMMNALSLEHVCALTADLLFEFCQFLLKISFVRIIGSTGFVCAELPECGMTAGVQRQYRMSLSLNGVFAQTVRS